MDQFNELTFEEDGLEYEISEELGELASSGFGHDTEWRSEQRLFI